MIYMIRVVGDADAVMDFEYVFWELLAGGRRTRYIGPYRAAR